MRRWLAILLFTLIWMTPVPGLAQFQQSWAVTFDGGLQYNDFTANMASDAAGNVYVAGTVNNGTNGATADITVRKYSTQGALLWYKTWDGPAANQDVAFGMALAPDGSVVVVGRTNTPLSSSDFVTLKFRGSDGALMWARTFDGPSHSIDEALDVAVDSAGGIVVVGEAWNDAEYYPNGDFCTLKYDSAGNLLWSRLYDGPGNWIASSDQPHRVVIDSQGDVIVSGDSPDLNNAARVATVKYRGTDGLPLWVLRTEDVAISGYHVALEVAPNNDVVIGMNSEDSGLQVVLIRVNSQTGSVTWVRRDAFPHGGRLRHRRAMALDLLGNPVIAVTYDPDLDNSNLNYNLQTTKYRFDTGDQVWSTSIGTTTKYDSQGAGVVTTDPAGNVLVAGQNLVVPHTRLALWQFRAADGVLLWSTDYAFPLSADYAERALFDSHGNILVAGQTVNTNNGFGDILVSKYGSSRADVSAVSFSPGSVVGGNSAIGTVTLSGPAPVGGLTVALADNKPQVSLPVSVVVPAGETTATFTAVTALVTSNVSATATASANGVAVTGTLVLMPLLGSVKVSPSSIVGGKTATGTITLNGPAPAAGIAVSLSSSNPAASSPTSVAVAGGATSATFLVTTTPVTASTAGKIVASHAGVSRSAAITVKPPVLSSLKLTPNPVTGWSSVAGTVTMSGRVAVDTIVTLGNSNSAVTLPAPSITIPAGASSASFVLTTSPTSIAVSGAVTSTAGSVTKSVTLKVAP